MFLDKVQVGNLSASIYNMIDILVCDTKGSPNPEAVQVLFKCLLPKLVAASTDSRSSNVSKTNNLVYFILQHICYQLLNCNSHSY